MPTLGTIVKAVGLKGEVKLLPGPDFWIEAFDAGGLDVHQGLGGLARRELTQPAHAAFLGHGNQIHGADRAPPGLVAADLRMHRARPLGGGCFPTIVGGRVRRGRRVRRQGRMKQEAHPDANEYDDQ